MPGRAFLDVKYPAGNATTTGAERPELQTRVDSTINQHGLAGDVSCPLGGKPHNGVGNLLWTAQAAKRSGCRPALVNVFWRGSRSQGTNPGELLQPLGRSVAGRYVVDGNAVLAELIGKTLDQPHDCGADGIREHQIGNGQLHGNRGDGDDPPPAMALHVG